MSEKKKANGEKPVTGISGRIDYTEIKKLIDFIEERNLSDFELETGDFKIRISRAAARPNGGRSQAANVAENPVPAAVPAEGQTPAAAAAAEANLLYVTSPMVGTFYRAPSPASPPFVEPGETVKSGQTMCIIEAMKLMNEIEADIDCRIVEVMVENAKPVEYGQKLFAIEPLGHPE